MPKSYLEIFETANDRYNRKDKRKGYVRTLFSGWRHRGLNPKALFLKTQLENANEDEAIEHIRKFLSDVKKYINNHSFASYLLDVLRENYPKDNWNKYDPKHVVFYVGTLYHGSTVSWKAIFAQGLRPSNSSDRIDDYTKTTSGGIGVSTTKEYRVARMYALPTPPGNDPLSPIIVGGLYGYVYTINYRGIAGFDIDETLKSRDQSAFKSIQEVNVRGIIPGCCIEKCSVYHKGKLIETVRNLMYRPYKHHFEDPRAEFLQSQYYVDSSQPSVHSLGAT